MVRDLHDGAQQRLVHTVITLKLARRALDNQDDTAPALVAEALEQAEDATDELGGHGQREPQAGAASQHKHGKQRLRAIGHGRERVRGQHGQRDQLAHPLVRDRSGPQRRAQHRTEQPAP